MNRHPAAADSPPPPALTVSVIIPTRDRPADLRAAVASLLQQSELPHELLIVDQSGSAESADSVAGLFAAAPQCVRDRVALQYIRDTSISGGAVARNRAMNLASGGIWLFLDDDVVLERDFVRELLNVYRADPGITGVSGIITNYVRPALGFRIWNAVFMRGPFRDPRLSVYWKAGRSGDAPPVSVDRFTGCLMSFRAAAMGSLRFDENLKGVSDGEDVDLCLRCPAGSRLVIAPRARLAHHHSPSGRVTDHWLRRSVRGQVYIYCRNWRRGLFNRLCYAWLLAGWTAVALAAALPSRSLRAWRALVNGRREGRQAAGLSARARP